jgi:hypothetical protein
VFRTSDRLVPVEKSTEMQLCFVRASQLHERLNFLFFLFRYV